MNKYKYNPINMTPFKWFVLENFPFIEEDFDSLTSYGLWCKLKNYFEEVSTKTNEMGTQVESLTNAFIVLKEYVDNYFKNLDVQEEINNKLDEMAESGVLEQIIEQFINSTALWCFDTINELINSRNLISGSYAKTLGYNSLNDGGKGLYKITNVLNANKYQILLNNGLYAELIPNETESIKTFGGVGNGTTSIIEPLNNALKTNVNTILFDNGNYLIDNTIEISKNLKGKNATIIMNRNNDNEFCIEFTGNNLKIENLNFHLLSSKKFLEIRNSNNIIISNCKFTTELDRENGGVLDIYTSNKNILVENCYFETHSNGAGGIWIREGTTNGLSENIKFDNCIFIGDTIDETIAIWGWKGTINNVHIENSKITRPINQNISNSFPITIGQSGITKNSGFSNCEFNIYQASSGIFHVCAENDENLFINNSIINTYMQNLTNGIIIMLSDNENFVVNNSIINQLNINENPNLSNSVKGKYKKCNFNCNTQIKMGRGNYENCIFNNSEINLQSNIGRCLEIRKCTFNNINNNGTQLFQCLNTNDYIIIEDSTFNYIQSPTRFIYASNLAYSQDKPLIVKNSIFKGLLYVNSDNISKGYVIGNYIGNNNEGYFKENFTHVNNVINFDY